MITLHFDHSQVEVSSKHVLAILTDNSCSKNDIIQAMIANELAKKGHPHGTDFAFVVSWYATRVLNVDIYTLDNVYLLQLGENGISEGRHDPLNLSKDDLVRLAKFYLFFERYDRLDDLLKKIGRPSEN